MSIRTVRIGKRGSLILPADIRKRFGLEENQLAIVETKEEGVLLRPAVALPIETYSKERKAEFLLSNAVDEADYQRARDEVRKMGLDPDAIEHALPGSE